MRTNLSKTRPKIKSIPNLQEKVLNPETKNLLDQKRSRKLKMTKRLLKNQSGNHQNQKTKK